jgi:tetratricopeptide (TPR) repeat protein
VKVEAWWKQHCSGLSVADAPDPEFLSRVLVSALDIAREAHFAHMDWEAALRCTDIMLELRRAPNRPDVDVGSTRMNRAVALRNLRRFSEARAELEDCLQLLQNDPLKSARTLSSLATLFAEQGDIPQAIAQERRALVLLEQLPVPGDRAISHNNLANYLDRNDTPSAFAESIRHQLAALIYFIACGLRQHLQTLQRNYAMDFRRAHVTGGTFTVPRVSELLADPAFRPLNDWLRHRQAGVVEVQVVIDEFLEMARRAALEQG